MIDSLSSGERNGKSLNTSECKSYIVAGCGLWDFSSGYVTDLGHELSRVEQDWKAGPKRVRAP